MVDKASEDRTIVPGLWSDAMLGRDTDNPRVKVVMDTGVEVAIENGLGHTVTTEIAIPQGQTANLAVTTPPLLEVHLKNRILNADGGVRYRPYAGPTLVLGADRNEAVNLNSLRPIPCFARLHDVTSVSDKGTSFDLVLIPNGSGQAGPPNAFSGEGVERILSKDSTFLLEFENTDNKAITVVFTLVWVERPNGYSAPES